MKLIALFQREKFDKIEFGFIASLSLWWRHRRLILQLGSTIRVSHSSHGKNEVSSPCRSISIQQNIIHEKLSIFQNPAWNSMAKFVNFEVPYLQKPLNRMNPDSVRDNYIHLWACLENFVSIAQNLWGVMPRKTHSPRSGRRRRKTKNKRSQNNFLESHVWSQISGKPVERKIWNFLRRV